jgi:tetratricopeptide (TPR) repeat protein
MRSEIPRKLFVAWLAVASSPNHVLLFGILARAHVLSGDPYSAIVALQRGLEQDSSNPLLLWRLADNLIQQRALDDAELILQRLRDVAPQSAFVEFLEGRLSLLQRRPERSIALLDRARVGALGNPELVAQAEFYLGESYRVLDQFDLALAAYRRAIQAEPFAVSPRMAAADLLLCQGQAAAAVGEYEKLTALPRAPDAALVGLARAHLLQQLELPQRDRDWNALHSTVERIASKQPESVDLALIRAELAAHAHSDLTKAIQLLEQAASAHPQHVDVWLALASAYRRAGSPECSDSTLVRAAKRCGNVAARGKGKLIPRSRSVKQPPRGAISTRPQISAFQSSV